MRRTNRRSSAFSPIRPPTADSKVQRIDTHAASVFLAGDRALKVKRAVRFPFLDYSTLEKRKQACEAEIAVNAPYAPEIYRGVVAITREAVGKLAHRRGRHAGRMGGRHARASMRSGRSTISPARSTTRWPMRSAASFAAAHAKTPDAKTPPVDPERWIAALGSYIDEHAEAFGQHPEIFPAAASDALARKAAPLTSAFFPFCASAAGRASSAASTAICISAISC